MAEKCVEPWVGMQVLHSNGKFVHPSPITCEESGERVLPSLSQEGSEKPELTSCTSGGDAQLTSKDTGRLEQVTRVILSQVRSSPWTSANKGGQSGGMTASWNGVGHRDVRNHYSR